MGSVIKSFRNCPGLFCALIVALSIPAISLFAAEPAGMVKTLKGNATVTRDAAVLPAAVGLRIYPGDRISSATDSFIGITLRDDTRLALGPKSEMLVRDFDFNSSTYAGKLAIAFYKGTARVITGLLARTEPDHMIFNTATTTIGIRGTDFIVDLDGQQMMLKAAFAGLVAAALAGCAAGPTERIILLPSESGKPSAVVLKTRDAELTLNTPYASADVQGTALKPVTVTSTQVENRYGGLLAAQPKTPKPFTIYFALGSDELTPESKAAFDQVRREITSWPAAEIVVTGHTDRLGTLEYNDRLSRQRAQLIANRLIAAGISANLIEVAARGEREPLIQTADEVAEPRNRRVEIKLR